jgi:hypothetical protein
VINGGILQTGLLNGELASREGKHSQLVIRVSDKQGVKILIQNGQAGVGHCPISATRSAENSIYKNSIEG